MTSIKQDVLDIMELAAEVIDQLPVKEFPDRPLTDGKIKNTLTGEVGEPYSRTLDDADKNLGTNRMESRW